MTMELIASNAHATPAPLVGARPVQAPGVSLLRLTRVEFRKQVNTPAAQAVLVLVLVVTIATMGPALWSGRQQGVALDALLIRALAPQALLLPILGILTACNEWSERTALVTFIQEPRRWRVVVAKVTATAGLALGLGVLPLGLVWVAQLMSSVLAPNHVPSLQGIPLAQVLAILTAQVLLVMQGIALGMAMLSIPLSLLVWASCPLEVVFLRMNDRLSQSQEWLSLSLAARAIAANGSPTLTSWAQLGTAGIIWVFVPLSVGMVRVYTKELP
ncbi:hypothetical protein ACTQ49_05670 [Luteococcus sp. Sow4_B9]|uniref:hypothetical protein n=1 Tax=Luteococcus sp. Sow4_B9 TaxID=3438792 RepID=UPI003F9DB137